MKEVPDIHIGVHAARLLFLSFLLSLIPMKYELDRGGHSVYTLTYHHVCCVSIAKI